MHDGKGNDGEDLRGKEPSKTHYNTYYFVGGWGAYQLRIILELDRPESEVNEWVQPWSHSLSSLL